jgi:hypothetical protein
MGLWAKEKDTSKIDKEKYSNKIQKICGVTTDFGSFLSRSESPPGTPSVMAQRARRRPRNLITSLIRFG